MCMQNSAGKRMLLLSGKATEAIKHFSYGKGTSAELVVVVSVHLNPKL